MELRQLQHFVAVAEEMSFTRAARRVNIVQSALSASIRTLEDELDAKLFLRSTRQMRLTNVGRVFLEKARGVIDSVRDARQTVAAMQGLERGTLGIVQLQRFLDLVDRQAGDLAAVVAAHWREADTIVGICGSKRILRTLAAARQVAAIGIQVVIVIGREDTGIDVRIAVVPKGGTVTITPYRVVVDVVEGEWPEYGADPSEPAMAMPPPVIMATPTGGREPAGDAGAEAWIAQCATLTQCTVYRPRVEGISHGPRVTAGIGGLPRSDGTAARDGRR